ncbi:MAG: hypothetical protein IKU24_04725, partial [Clostridia bacterium]|nr:hypothetical protein [Clostridia bacterium]
MKLNRNLLKTILVLIYILVPFACFLRIHTYWNDLDIYTGFFLEKSLSCTIYNGIGFFVFFLCLLLPFVKKDLPSKKKKEEKLPELFLEEKEDDFTFSTDEEPAFLDEVASVYETPPLPLDFLEGPSKKAATWNGTLSAFSSFLPIFGFFALTFSVFANSKTQNGIFSPFYAVITVLSGLFFLVLTLRKSPVKSKVIAFFALSPALWCTMRMVIEYRDLTGFMNKSLYTGQFLFVVSALIFFLYQAELLLGENALTKPNSYAFFGVSTVFFGLT